MIKIGFVLLVASYLVSFTQAQPWPRHTIDAVGSGADGVKLGDINGDGWLDIATGWEESGVTKLYLHPGPQKVKSKWPKVTVGQTPAVEDAVFVDLDKNGNLDIVSCSERGVEKIFIHWAPESDWLHEEKWRQSELAEATEITLWMYAEPLQLDGKHAVDLIAAGKGNPSVIGWFEATRKTASKRSNWKWHPISEVGWIMSIILHDMDGDADMDVVITDRRGALRACRWLENPGPGSRQKSPWPNHLIGAAGLEVMFMDLADLDGDGIAEIVVSERTKERICIYKRQNTKGTIWSEQTIPLPKNTGRAKSVAAGDINGDGVVDLVISTNTEGQLLHGLFWWDGRQLKREEGPVLQSISGAHNAKYDKVELIDLDADGDLDVLICEENYGEDSEGLGVVWYENRL